MDTTGTGGRNLILIGFMGTGKTTVGRRVAKSLGLRFVDTDEEIVKRAGKSIPQIFAEVGEEAFRKLETEVLTAVGEQVGQVISTGGGIVTRPENQAILARAGYVIWLCASSEIIYDRVSRSKDRPLLQTNDPMETIKKLLESRDPLYEQCRDLTITTDELTLEETCFGVTESARLALAGST